MLIVLDDYLRYILFAFFSLFGKTNCLQFSDIETLRVYLSKMITKINIVEVDTFFI